ncbi:MAG: GNAT family N-acetyltransferase [Chloroflexota bacterium]|nr:GNAT family N-acetyltransferase [Chloroflexota bacterium]
MERQIYRDAESLTELRAEWNTLLAQSQVNTPFLTWEWQTTWWNNLGTGDLWVVTWRDQGELVAIVPLYLTINAEGERQLDTIGCIEVSDYLDLIIAAGREEEVFRAFLDWLLGPEAPDWDVLALCNLAQHSPSHRYLPEHAAARGLHAITRLEDVCPVIQLPEDWETYLQTRLDKKQRHEIRRKKRKIQREADVNWYVVDDTRALDAEIDDFVRLHRLSAEAKEGFMTGEMEQFFRQIARAMYDSGWLSLAFIEVNGDKAASMLSLCYEDRCLLYNSGYDPNRYRELSPGIVLTGLVIEDAIDRGYSVFDFLQGDEVYKYRFGATDTAVYTTVIRRPEEKLTGSG